MFAPIVVAAFRIPMITPVDSLYVIARRRELKLLLEGIARKKSLAWPQRLGNALVGRSWTGTERSLDRRHRRGEAFRGARHRGSAGGQAEG